MRHAARSTRVSSTEPSTGTSPATLTIAVKDSMDSTAIASSSCSSRPARLARLLVQVLRELRAVAEQRAQVAQQRGLARRRRSPSAWRARPRRCRGPACRLGARVQLQAGLGAVVLGHREPDPLGAVPRQRAVAELGAEAHVRLQRRGRAGQHAEEVRELPGRRRRTLEDRAATPRAPSGRRGWGTDSSLSWALPPPWGSWGAYER